MDIQGKPKMSRALVRRLSHAIDSGRQALGPASAVNTPDLAVRRTIYRQSHLGSSHGIRRVGAEFGVPRRLDRKDTIASKPEHLSTDANRPSAGFEATNRKYDPYA